jgi:hypothetical protein
VATSCNTLSKTGVNGNKWHLFQARWFSKSAISNLRRSKRALLVIVLLASSAAALASLGFWRTVRPASRLAPVNAASAVGGAVKTYEPPATTNPPLTKLREYVYAGGRLITSEEKSCVPALSPASANLPQVGGTGSFTVSTPPECNWSATPDAGWITVTGSSSGAGNGTVGYEWRRAARRNDHRQRTGVPRHPGAESGQLQLFAQYTRRVDQ